MSEVICGKCGETAYSKCPYCRNVFPENGTLTIFNNRVTLKKAKGEQKGYPYEVWTMGVEVYVDRGQGDTPESQAAAFFKDVARAVAAGTFTWEQLVCDHDWEFCEGQESSISCGHGWTAQEARRKEVKSG
jgi:hypothetical protein